jgi:putative endonuclease
MVEEITMKAATPQEQKQTLGQRGENVIAKLMQQRGYEVLARNWRCSYGEIDIVGRSGDTLIICEVKTRKTLIAGTPESEIAPRKKERIQKMAELYIKCEQPRTSTVRMDIGTVVVYRPDRAMVRYLEDVLRHKD